MQPHAHPVLESLRVDGTQKRRRRGRRLHVRGEEWDRSAAERTRQQAPELPTVVGDHRERRQFSVADGRRDFTDPFRASLDVGWVRVHARSGIPALALNFELRRLGLVRQQLELLKTRLETELAQRFRDDVGRLLRVRAAGGAGADADRERLDQVHACESTVRRW